MPVQLINLADVHLKYHKYHVVTDDFSHIIEGQGSAGTATDFGITKWSETGDAGGETNIPDGVGGQLNLNTDADDNDEWYFYTTRELFLFANNKPIVFQARVNFTEASTDDANIMVGLMDGVAANALQDDGAGPKASYSGMVFFKEDGQTLWTVESSLAATQTTTQTEHTAGGGWQTLRLEFRPHSSTEADVIGWIDTSGGENFAQVRNSSSDEFSHKLTYTSATEMSIVFGIKNGGGNAELLLVDYVLCAQLR